MRMTQPEVTPRALRKLLLKAADPTTTTSSSSMHTLSTRQRMASVKCKTQDIKVIKTNQAVAPATLGVCPAIAVVAIHPTQVQRPIRVMVLEDSALLSLSEDSDDSDNSDESRDSIGSVLTVSSPARRSTGLGQKGNNVDCLSVMQKQLMQMSTDLSAARVDIAKANTTALRHNAEMMTLRSMVVRMTSALTSHAAATSSASHALSDKLTDACLPLMM